MKQGKTASGNQGFTLIEVLLALLVLGISFIPVSNALLMSARLNQHFREQVPAVREAQAAVEMTLTGISLYQSESNPGEKECLEDEPYPADVSLIWEDVPLLMITAGPFSTVRHPGTPPWLEKSYTWVPGP